ncbi:MAG: UPF0701 family [Verrucomicrobia bacterium]|nr:MAG: UPF0701 family [Verrucomicrobiota bacterium]
MHSMTGYGRGEASTDSVRLSVELHSVNRKHIDIALSLPRALQPIEGRIREKIQSRIARGRLNVNVNLLPSGDAACVQVIDENLAGLYAQAMRQLQQKLGLVGEISLDLILRAPGVLLTPGQDADPETVWPVLEEALHAALQSLLAMRQTEGSALASDLSMRLVSLQQCAECIEARAPNVTQRYRTQLLERLRTAEIEIALTDERLLRELALFADRSDISEELTRLRSHFAQMEKLLQQEGSVGRTLEFLTQEIAREFNTLGVKSNDSQISHWVVEGKAELEKIREQIQNIE